LPNQPNKKNPLSKLAQIPPSIARILTAVVLLPILIASIVIPKLSLLFVILVGIAIILALLEFWLLARKQQIRADPAAGLLAAVALIVVFYFTDRKGPDLLTLILVVVLLTICSLVAAILRGAPFDRMISSSAVTVLGVLYVALLGGHLIAVRTGFGSQLSKHLLLFFFLVLMGGDSGAYYAGKTFGRHKLAPTVSPGKTWEGAVASMLTSLLLAAAAHYWFFPELTVGASLCLPNVLPA